MCFQIFFFFFIFPHHHKQGCPPSWQGMEALWNWRRAGWSAALYGADKTPSGRPTLNKTSSIIFAGRASLSSLAVEALIYFWLPKKSANVLWWFARFWKCSFTIVCTLLHVLQPVSAAYNPSYIAALALPWATLSPQLYGIQNSPTVDGLFGGQPTETSASHEQADGFSRRSVNRTKLRNVPILNCNVETHRRLRVPWIPLMSPESVKKAGMRWSRDQRVGKYCQSGGGRWQDKSGACVTPTRNSK